MQEPKILALENEIAKRKVRYTIYSTAKSNISMTDGYGKKDIIMTGEKALNNNGYFSRQGNYIKVLKACTLRISAFVVFDRLNRWY